MMRSCLLYAALLSLCSEVLSQTPSPVTVVDSKQNLTYVGFSDYGVDEFLNIQYGQDTSGANRFKHPVAFQYPTGTTIDATKAGASCPQNTLTSLAGNSFNEGVYDISEDCLNLRVARPSGAHANAGLPVMVWIYGGSDENGSDNYTLYDPLALVAGAAQKDTPVVFVSMNYRVNVFGFANNSALAAEKSQNSGLWDQRLALDWVQENIAVFGGDPDQVMLFGQSDGGTSTGIHLTSFGGKGNISFTSAIVESDAATGDPGVSGNYTLGSTITVAELAGCKGNATFIIECMRGLPMNTLLDAVLQYENISSTRIAQDIFFPTVDDDLIPAAPSVLLREGRFHKVPIMTGWAYNDGAIFTPTTINSSEYVYGYLQANYPYFSNQTIEELLALYPIEDFSGNAQAGISPYFFQAQAIFRDANFACGSIFMAQQFAKHGMPAYLYDFNITAYTALLAAGNVSFEGVIHTSEIAFVFNIATLLATNNSANIAAVAQFQPLVSGSWAQFATSHDPSGKNASNSLQGWTPAFASADAAKKVNVTEVSLRVVAGPYNGQVNLTADATGGPEPMLLKRCEFINTPAFYRDLRT